MILPDDPVFDALFHLFEGGFLFIILDNHIHPVRVPYRSVSRKYST